MPNDVNEMQRGYFTSIIAENDDDEYINDSEVSDELYRSVDAFSSDDEGDAAEFYANMENNEGEFDMSFDAAQSPKVSLNDGDYRP